MSDKHHDKGQRDGSSGRYDPPHERVEDLVKNIISGETKGEREDRDSYEKGYSNGKGQKEGRW